MPQAIPLPTPPPADTLAAADTLSLVERVRTDSSLRITNLPENVRTFSRTLRETLLDPDVWLGFLGVGVRIVLILFLAYAAIRLIDRLTTRWTRGLSELPAMHPRRQRALTLSNLFSSTVRYVAWPIALITALSELGLDVGALLATAGIAGLAIGFGAQTLVKDVISGIFLLFDDSIHVGDILRIGTDSGTVEHLGVRLIKVRKFDGELLMVPAGELRVFGNKSIGFARVIVELAIPYEQDPEAVFVIMKRVAEGWAAAHRDILLEEKPSVEGIMRFGEAAFDVRVVVMVTAGTQWAAERELRVLLKRAFDEAGIDLPLTRRTRFLRDDPAAPAPAPVPGDPPR